MPMCPLLGLHSHAGLEEVGARCGLVEDVENELEHNLLDLGDWEGLGRLDKLQSATHQVCVPLRHKFDPSNCRGGRCALSGSHEADEPALIQVPSRFEGPKTKFLRCGRGTLRLGGLRGGDGEG